MFTFIKVRQKISLYLFQKGFTLFDFDLSEFAEKGSLYDYLQNPNNPMDFQHILPWAREIAQGEVLF